MKHYLLAFLLVFAAIWPDFAEAGSRAFFYQRQGAGIITIQLEPGYKTYWRMPGEAGIAPQFDWRGSENLAQAKVEMPAPRRFAEAEGEVVGYEGEVSFLVRLTPVDSAKPIKARLALNYAICKDICLPVDVTLLPEAAPDGVIEAVENRLPRLFSGAQVKVDAHALEILLPMVADDIFIEQDGVLAYFRKAQEIAPGHYLVPVDGDLAGLYGKTLHLTVISGADSFVSQVIVP